MSFSFASVVETRQLSPRIRWITLQVHDPGALDVQRAGHSAVGIYFPDSGDDGRNYSVRLHDGDRIDLDVVLHSRGPGTTWGRTAVPGDRVGLDHARSWYGPRPPGDWQLLVTGLTGLPATARIIEQLPDGYRATAIVEVADAEDVDYLPSPHGLTVIPSIGSGNGDGPSRLAELVQCVGLPDGRGYCWFAGEAAELRTVRTDFRGLGWTIDQLDVTG